MAKLILIVFASVFSALFNPPANEVFKVDVNRSKIEWIGKKITGAHTGELKLSSGEFQVNAGKIVSGDFTIAMNSMQVTDLRGADATRLLGHLKSEDFFSTEDFPIAKFTITNIKQQEAEKVSVTGDLTIKGITNSINFLASIKQRNAVLVAVANHVKVDRTKYAIKYGSKNFITGLGDKAIDDFFELNISIVAKNLNHPVNNP